MSAPNILMFLLVDFNMLVDFNIVGRTRCFPLSVLLWLKEASLA